MQINRKLSLQLALAVCALMLCVTLSGIFSPVSSQTSAARWGDRGFNWVGDFNGDGRADLASAHPDGEITMRLSTGQRFERSTWFVQTPWGGAQYTWAVDFNNDGKTDLVTAKDTNLFVHLSDGSQFNTLRLVVPNQWGGPGYNWAGDFNGNGNSADLASAQRDGTVTLRFSTEKDVEHINWFVPTPWGGDRYSWAADFNGDGKTDLITAQQTNLFVHLTENDGFRTLRLIISDQWGDRGFNWTGDFNGDGRADLASALRSGEVAMRFSIEEDVEESTWYVPTPWGTDRYSWAADFNGDGQTDLITARQADLFVHLSNGTEFTTLRLVVPDQWGDPDYNWVGDFNGDGKMDIASAVPGGDAIVRVSTGDDVQTLNWTASN